MVFNPIKLKFNKEHKKTFKNKEYSLNNTKLLYGRFGISSKVKGLLCYKEIFAAKKIILKAIKGIGILVTRVYPIRPRTKKKGGMRMGKGKGNVSSWVVNVKAGTVLFEVTGPVETKTIKLAFKTAAARLNLGTKNLIY